MIFIAKNEACTVKKCMKKRKTKLYCSMHAEQMRVFGKIREITRRSPNRIFLDGKTVKIELLDKTLQPVAYTLIDNEDMNKIIRYKWCLGSKRYVVGKKDRKGIRLHRLLLNVKDMQVDHINGDTLDNRKQNLRIVRSAQNANNKHAPPKSDSGHTGVLFYKRSGKWLAWISIYGKYKHLGYFDTLKDAVEKRENAYNQYKVELGLL